MPYRPDPRDITTRVKKDLSYHVYIGEYTEPIVVERNDVLLPEWAKPAASGIMLDIRAILA